MQKLAYERFVRQARNRDLGYALRAHQLFRRARDWQYDVFRHGTHSKHRVITSHLKVLCLALIWFDPTGSGTSIFPSLKKLLGRVNAIERERAAGGKLRLWNMRKLYRYLRVLEDSKLMECRGSRHNRKPRNRFLFAEKLLKVKPGRRESVSREPASLSPVASNVSPKNSGFYSPKEEQTSARLRPRGIARSRFQPWRNAVNSGRPIERSPARTGVLILNDTGEPTLRELLAGERGNARTGQNSGPSGHEPGGCS